MSADLFAEFSQPVAKQTSAAPSQSQSQPPQPPAYQSSANTPLQALDPFEFGYGSGSSSQFSPSPQQWSSFLPQPASVPMQPAAEPPLQQIQNAAEDDDGWGDFEVAAEACPQPSQLHQPALDQPIAWPDAAAPAHSRASHNFIDDSFVNTAEQLPQETDHAWPQPKPKRKNAVKSQVADPGVLFDAADFELENGEFEGESDEEFGDFETVKPTAPPPKKPAAPSAHPPALQRPSMPSMDLLSLYDSETVQQSQPPRNVNPSSSGPLHFGASFPSKSEPKRSYIQGSDSNTRIQTKPLSSTVQIPSKTQQKPKSPLGDSKTSAPWAAAADDDEWAAWDDASSSNAVDATAAEVSWDRDARSYQKGDTAVLASSDDSPPPTNVPPPSILLSLFPELLNYGSALFKLTSGQSGSVREQILSNPKTVQFLQGYILLAITAARVMAGRKHRWHRDKILAKSMSISAAGSKGMKLAGVDKTQTAREDREAADVVAVWREHVGRLRSAVTVANSSSKANFQVPELSETLSAHTAKLVPTAPKPCVICGLKRDERITKVDFAVEDSFGEWWVEHWGHRACKNFWIEHEKSLRQR